MCVDGGLESMFYKDQKSTIKATGVAQNFWIPKVKCRTLSLDSPKASMFMFDSKTLCF